MRLRSLSFPKQAPAPQRDGRPALGRRCHAKALRWRFFPLSYAIVHGQILTFAEPEPAQLVEQRRDTSAHHRAHTGGRVEAAGNKGHSPIESQARARVCARPSLECHGTVADLLGQWRSFHRSAGLA